MPECPRHLQCHSIAHKSISRPSSPLKPIMLQYTIPPHLAPSCLSASRTISAHKQSRHRSSRSSNPALFSNYEIVLWCGVSMLYSYSFLAGLIDPSVISQYFSQEFPVFIRNVLATRPLVALLSSGGFRLSAIL